jgi:hypothetical protein
MPPRRRAVRGETRPPDRAPRPRRAARDQVLSATGGQFEVAMPADVAGTGPRRRAAHGRRRRARRRPLRAAGSRSARAC